MGRLDCDPLDQKRLHPAVLRTRRQLLLRAYSHQNADLYTTTYVFCCIPWTNNFTQTDERTDLDYCTIGQGCLSCPLIPPCSL